MKPKITIIIVLLLLYMIYIPLISRINFMQNDDWYYYEQVQQFLKGNFTLNNQLAPTFYIQGILGVLVASTLGMGAIPTLTYIIGLLNCVVMCFILRKVLKTPWFFALLYILLLFVNPLFQYALVGFMTEQYMLFFSLCAIYFLVTFEKSNKIHHLYLFLGFCIIAFFVKQVSLALLLSAVIFYLIKKLEGMPDKAMLTKFKITYWFNNPWKNPFLLTTLAFTSLLVFYYGFFPKSTEMQEKSLQLHHLLQVEYSTTIVIGTLLYLVAFTIPLIIDLIINWYSITIYQRDNGRYYTIAITILGALIFYIITIIFKPLAISWGEFPYFENTWERTGFLVRDINGTPYQFKGIFDLYYYWELTAKILLAIFIPIVFLTKHTGVVSYFARIVRKKWLISSSLHTRFCASKLVTNYYAIFTSIYILLMVITHTFYDRYLIILIPIGILGLAQAKQNIEANSKMYQLRHLHDIIFMIITLVFITGTGFYSYQLNSNFILRENLIWTKAIELTTEQKHVYATSAWNEKYKITKETAHYLISYDSPQINPELTESHTLIDTIDIIYPANIYINPIIYIYEKN